MKKILLIIALVNAYLTFSQCSLNVNINITNSTDSVQCNGSVIAFVSGNNGPVTYTWNCNTCANVYSQNLTGLCAGSTGTVTVADTFGCIATATWNIGFINCSNFGASIASTPTTGLNSCDGSILASPYGGTAPYYYAIGNGTVTYGSNNPTNLCAGSYTVNATDANGCSFSGTTTVGVDTCAGLSVSFSNVTNASSPSACDGLASIIANGGTAPYVYSWSNGMTTMNASNLCSGVYQVCVTSSNGCQVCDSFLISDSSNVCQGFYATAQTTNATDASTCDGSMNIIATGGATPYTYSYANAGTSSNATALNLCPGTYTATVVDANGCAATIVGNVLSNANLGDTLVINGNIFIDSTVVGADSSAWINNCSIYYDSIINGYISNYSVIATDSILVSWVLAYNNGDSVIVNTVYNLNSGNGTYVLTLLLYCPIKSVPKYLMVSSEFDYQFSSLNENKSDLLFIYPNPSENFIQVKGLKSGSSYRITDLSGKEVISGNYEQVINVSNLGHGTYLLLVTDKNQNKVLRFVK